MMQISLRMWNWKERTALIQKQQLRSEEDINNKKLPEETLNSEVSIYYRLLLQPNLVNETTCWKQAMRIMPGFS